MPVPRPDLLEAISCHRGSWSLVGEKQKCDSGVPGGTSSRFQLSWRPGHTHARPHMPRCPILARFPLCWSWLQLHLHLLQSRVTFVSLSLDFQIQWGRRLGSVDRSQSCVQTTWGVFTPPSQKMV